MWFLFTSFALHSLRLKNIRSWDITVTYQNCLSPDHKILSNFFIIHQIISKFSKNLFDTNMHISTTFDHYRLRSSWSFLRLTAKGHLDLSDFLQSWWAVVYWDPQQLYQVWSKSGENWNFLRVMLEKGPSGQPPLARVALSPRAPAAHCRLPFPPSHTHKGRKFFKSRNMGYTENEIATTFSLFGAILLKFGTHINSG